jgi:hypothetical protein
LRTPVEFLHVNSTNVNRRFAIEVAKSGLGCWEQRNALIEDHFES